MFEQEAIEHCLNRLNDLNGITATRTVENIPFGKPVQLWDNRFFWDAEIDVEFAGKRQHFGVECKYNFTTTTAAHTVAMLKAILGEAKTATAKRTKPLIFADYINDKAAGVLRKNNINYVDAVGNIYLTYPTGLYVEVQGKKREVEAAKRKGRLFQPTGLKIIINLLIKPELINLPQRKIGHEAGVALGTVAWVIRELREDRYVGQTGPNQVKLIRKKELFEKWVEGYVEKLKPKLLLGKYAAATKDIDIIVNYAANVLDHKQIKWAITGAYAEDALINYYRTRNLTIFVDEWDDDLIQQLEWIPAKEGTITVLQGFGLGLYDQDEIYMGRLRVAHPLMIYAELIADGNDRAKDAAARIYEKYIRAMIEDE